MKLIDVCNPVEIKNASQCAFLPFTPVPREFAGKTVRIVIVVEDVAAAAPEPDDLPPEQRGLI
jgi:hypothetical protein